jgi:hypothetical protein
VSLRTLRRKPHNFFKIRARRNQIAFLQRRHALLISGAHSRSCIRNIRGLRSGDRGGSAEEKRQRGAPLKEKRPMMNENQFHAKLYL